MAKRKKSVETLVFEAIEKKSKRIDFRYIEEQINEVPNEVFEIDSLVEIDFGTIPITSMSDKICNLKNLKTVTIQNYESNNFPSVFREIPSLRNLTFCSQGISSIPDWLMEWKQLEYLNISDCKNLRDIAGLPPNLVYLHIGGTAIQKIPDLVFDLKRLKKIVLHNLGLKNIPKELFEMKSLSSLFIGENNLSTLPEELASLEDLVEVILYENNFKVFPSILGQMESLKVIRLSRNQISEINCNLEKLIKLRTIDLADNIFTVFPEELRDLKNIENIVFSNIFNSSKDKTRPFNQIKEIPTWILELSKLDSLGLDYNPITDIPVEIVREGVAAIKNFISSKLEADTEELLCEAKMVMVGRGNVGKSVLTKKLTLPSYNLSESETTKGIDILKNPFVFPIEISGEHINFKFNIWDFGGQEKYDATHQLFITSRSVYIFLTEAREESNYSDFQFWLNTISLFSNNSPVIVVLSKCDERRKQLPESIYKEKFENIVGFVEVSCANGYEYTIENLRRLVNQAIERLPQTKQKLSNRWVDVRKELETLSTIKDYLPYNEYLALCKKYKLNKSQADFLSQYLNDLGVIIHHQYDLLLRKTVFINTDWCVDGMYKVLDDELVERSNGKISNTNLLEIWNESRFENKQEELLKLMKEYDLCFELKDGSGFIAPDLLPPDRSVDFVWKSDSNLKIEFRYDFMPAGILSRFIVKSHSFIRDNLYWKHGVVLEYDETLALVEEDYINNKVKISITGTNRKGLFSAIRMFIDEVHKDFNKTNKLSFEEMVPCNCAECSKSDVPHFYKFNVLRKFEQNSISEIICENSVISVKIKSLINDVQIKSPPYIESESDLKNMILLIIDNVLMKEITLKDGYIAFWRDMACKNPKNETEFQPYISNALDNFCKVKGINLSREVREAAGSVDILFSHTNKDNKVLKVCLEIKKAHHQNVDIAIKTQLPLYMTSAETEAGIYMVIWFKHKSFILPKNYNSEDELLEKIEQNNPDNDKISVRILNCCKPISPSKA
jgi:internalin A